jgi:hypothetical protein
MMTFSMITYFGVDFYKRLHFIIQLNIINTYLFHAIGNLLFVALHGAIVFFLSMMGVDFYVKKTVNVNKTCQNS